MVRIRFDRNHVSLPRRSFQSRDDFTNRQVLLDVDRARVAILGVTDKQRLERENPIGPGIRRRCPWDGRQIVGTVTGLARFECPPGLPVAKVDDRFIQI